MRTKVNGLTLEKDWSQQVYDAARQLGWLSYRVLRSKGSTPGVPDLLLLKPPRLIFAELKDEKAKPRPAQILWLETLAEIEGVETFVWRPQDWDLVLAILNGAMVEYDEDAA